MCVCVPQQSHTRPWGVPLPPSWTTRRGTSALNGVCLFSTRGCLEELPSRRENVPSPRLPTFRRRPKAKAFARLPGTRRRRGPPRQLGEQKLVQCMDAGYMGTLQPFRTSCRGALAPVGILVPSSALPLARGLTPLYCPHRPQLTVTPLAEGICGGGVESVLTEQVGSTLFPPPRDSF